MPAPYVQCRYMRGSGEQCTAEAVDDSVDAHIVICQRHLAKAMQLVRERAIAAAPTSTTRRFL